MSSSVGSRAFLLFFSLFFFFWLLVSVWILKAITRLQQEHKASGA